ncbi:hypothetical protein ACMHYB_25130 [Sorangium sp. So ce1128]
MISGFEHRCSSSRRRTGACKPPRSGRSYQTVARRRERAPSRQRPPAAPGGSGQFHPAADRPLRAVPLRNPAATLQASIETQLFITTHAPLVLASAEPHFDEARDALFLFDLDGDEVTVSKPAWKPRGDASSWLTSDVFDLAQARSVEAERAILDAMAAMRRPDLPIEIPDGWFVLELSFLQVLPAEGLHDEARERVQATIERLKLDDKECIAAREMYYTAYLDKGLTLELLQEWSPFVAREVVRQGLARRE